MIVPGIAENCKIYTHGAWLSELDGFPVKFSPVRIGNHVWIGLNVTILPGTRCKQRNYRS